MCVCVRCMYYIWRWCKLPSIYRHMQLHLFELTCSCAHTVHMHACSLRWSTLLNANCGLPLFCAVNSLSTLPIHSSSSTPPPPPSPLSFPSSHPQGREAGTCVYEPIRHLHCWSGRVWGKEELSSGEGGCCVQHGPTQPTTTCCK